MTRRQGSSRANRRSWRWAQQSSRLVLVGLMLVPVSGCGGDDEEDPVISACESICQDITNGCALLQPNPSDCAAACELGGAIQPDCKEDYAAVIQCADERPLLTCQGDTISVSLSAPACLELLGGYVTCAAANLLPVCVPLPVLNAGCDTPGLPQATACVGVVEGCEQQVGATAGSNGAGIYCCP